MQQCFHVYFVFNYFRHTVVDPTVSNDNSLPFHPVSHCHMIDSVNDMALYNLRTHQASSILATALLLDLGAKPRGPMYRQHSGREGGLCMAGNLSSERQEGSSESGLLLDRTSLSSILDITCEDDADGDDDAFELPPAMEEPEKLLTADGQRGAGCCNMQRQHRCSSCTRMPKSRKSRSTPSLRCSNAKGQNSTLPCHQDNSSVFVSNTVASHRSSSGTGVDSADCHENHIQRKPRCKLSRSNSFSYGRMAKKRTTVANNIPPDTSPHAGNRTRISSLHGRK